MRRTVRGGRCLPACALLTVGTSFSPSLSRRSSAAKNAARSFTRRKFSAEAPAAPAKAKSRLITFSEPHWGVITGVIVTGAAAAVAAGVSVWQSNSAKSDVAALKTEQEKTLAAEKATLEKTLAAEKAVLKAQADSVKAQADSLKAQADSLKTQAWAAYLLPTLTSLGAFGLGAFAVYSGKKP